MTVPPVSETIEVACPECGKTYRVAAQRAGARARCAVCKAIFDVVASPPPGSPPLPDNGFGTGVCPICRTSAAGQTIRCPQCHAPHHQECWGYNGGCGKYGCQAAPAAEKLTELEIPAGYWGESEKECPVCRNRIQAAALRCRHCGTTFSTARPQASSEFQASHSIEQRLPRIRKASIWLLILSVLPCTTVFAAIGGTIWYAANRKQIAALPAPQAAIARIGLGVALIQTVILILVMVLHGLMR